MARNWKITTDDLVSYAINEENIDRAGRHMSVVADRWQDFIDLAEIVIESYRSISPPAHEIDSNVNDLAEALFRQFGKERRVETTMTDEIEIEILACVLASMAWHDHPSNPSSCNMFEQNSARNGARCPCENDWQSFVDQARKEVKGRSA